MNWIPAPLAMLLVSTTGFLQAALFDVKADPFERHDLSSLAEHKQDVARLRTQLDRWWKPNELEISDLETRVVAKADGRWFGRATVERTAEGTLVLCYRGASRHTGSDGVIHVRFSSDGGQNWSNADHATDGSPIAGFPISFEGDDAFEPYLYAAPNGKVILHVWRTTGPNHREGKGTWQTDSADGGQTWSKLRTLLDFRDSPQLSDAAEKHIIGFIETWPTSKKHLADRAHWPPGFTENHDLMYLTLALFGEQGRGGDGSAQIREIKKFIAHRMERGFVEWNSKCYQYHFSNPLIILVDHAPDDTLRRAAQDLLNIMLAERALLSVNGYLGGPSLRCRTADGNHSLTARKVAYLTNARYDGFLPTVWLALGMGEPRFNFDNARVPGLEPAGIHIASGNEPRLKQDEGMFFACSRFVPHPVIRALATDARTRKALVYQGRRYLGWPSFK